MIDNIGTFIAMATEAARSHGLQPTSRVIVREGKNGPERSVEHVVMRTGLLGPELIIQTTASPLVG